VTNKDRPVTGLVEHDFRIIDDGTPVKPEVFEARGPASIIFVIDTSTSMRGEKWRNLKEGLKQFLRKQQGTTDYTLVVFNDTASLISQSIDPAEFWKAFTAIRPDGETALYDGLATGLDQVNCIARHRKAVVLLSDGEDNKSKTDLAAIEHLVFKTHTTIYAVGIVIDSSQPDRYRGRDLLQQLASHTGGMSFFPTAAKIESVLSIINAEIASHYSFGYYASNTSTPGWRNVDVQLTRYFKDTTLRYPSRYLLK
jgi:VWFA-related protein